MVEHRRLGRARSTRVVVTGDRVQQLGARVRLDAGASLLDHAQAEVDVAEQPTLVGLPEGRAGGQLRDAADVVQQRRREQQVGAQPRMQLGRLATDRRHANRVLEQAARIGVVILCSGKPTQRRAQHVVREEPGHDSREAVV